MYWRSRRTGHDDHGAFAAAPRDTVSGGPHSRRCSSEEAVLAIPRWTGSDRAASANHQDAENEVVSARAPIDADAKALEAQRATLNPDDFRQKQQAIAQRLQLCRNCRSAVGEIN